MARNASVSRILPHSPLLALALLGACTGGDRGVANLSDGLTGFGTDGGGSGDPSSSSSTTGGSASGGGNTTDDSTGGDSGGDDGGGIKFDTLSGDGGNAGDGTSNGCEKVDFLFVIDNSGSMEDEQLNLVGSFPGFISAIQDTLMAQNYHVMVVDTDEGGAAPSYISCSPDCCAQACVESPNAICNGNPCSGPGEPCDTTLGAGKTLDASGESCALPAGQRFMTDLQPNLGATFACVGQVGVTGDGNERPVEAMLEAVSDGLNGPGECNEGFLRDDAILVAVLITDEEDLDKTPGDPAAWRDALVAAKNGNEEAVVMLGLVGDSDLPNPVCDPYANGGEGAEAAPRLRELVESFPKGVWGSVCEADYSPFFLEAVSVIDAACDDFHPEG